MRVTKEHDTKTSSAQLDGFPIHAVQLDLIGLDLPFRRDALERDWSVIIRAIDVLNGHQPS